MVTSFSEYKVWQESDGRWVGKEVTTYSDGIIHTGSLLIIGYDFKNKEEATRECNRYF